ncbi:hypothetical protein R3P38DRAFT_3166074 [Favolaschia claudopus]|uniref:Uncharacterized protein n=1 Tax=Favolaschia claudopus TaxID=2862362 RepID=A0AAW0EJS2_9AGAR
MLTSPALGTQELFKPSQLAAPAVLKLLNSSSRPNGNSPPISTLCSLDLSSPSTPELRPCIDAINHPEWNTDFAADFFNFRNFRLNGGRSATYQDGLSIPTENRMIW